LESRAIALASSQQYSLLWEQVTEEKKLPLFLVMASLVKIWEAKGGVLRKQHKFALHLS
jgi:hypothetical protein